MRYDEFLARVRERGEYADREEAAKVTDAVLEVLAGRIPASEAEDLAAQLPAPLDDRVTSAAAEQPETYGVEEFYRRVGKRTGAHERTAQWDASAVLTTLAQTVSPGQLNQLISRLPTGYAALFGRADLTD
ncbi:DUF2267 domain-containing protein [Streptomyces echinoruber]|uniref:DUF2267 domain-containing protein n=1 Tax=Streptomyces echinoruber TaxID=68898 RepID=A0A918RAL6_9ACTN|nr:DUF2267 domain-containing protein [Streptomyces echinoruber]GGZ91652.1 hypothetical protein GCM10010389_32660 [Streptomyces echinoruber]